MVGLRWDCLRVLLYGFGFKIIVECVVVLNLDIFSGWFEWFFVFFYVLWIEILF